MAEYNAHDLARLSELIAERTGLNTFTSHRQPLIAALQNEGIDNIDAYCAYLTLLDESHPIWQSLLADVTVGETYFMRDRPQIEALRTHILPTIIRHQQQRGTLTVNIWSAGCATGEEAYTLAILVREQLADSTPWKVNITGSDISLPALEIAERGSYSAWSFRNTPPSFRERYFVEESHGRFRVRPEIRNMVNFRHDNLVNSRQYQQDLIVCRNVLIYFTRQQIQIAEQSLTIALKDNGWLLLSSVESLRHERNHYVVHNVAKSIAFQRKSSTATAATSVAPTETRMNDRYQAVVNALHLGRILEAETLTANAQHQNGIAWKMLRASIALARGDNNIARRLLQTVSHEHPFAADAHYLLALLQLEEGDLLAARTSLRAALYCHPQHALSRLLNGDVFMRRGDFDRASREWAMARTLARQLPTDTYLSDFADVTAGQLVLLVNHRLE